MTDKRKQMERKVLSSKLLRSEFKTQNWNSLTSFLQGIGGIVGTTSFLREEVEIEYRRAEQLANKNWSKHEIFFGNELYQVQLENWNFPVEKRQVWTQKRFIVTIFEENPERL